MRLLALLVAATASVAVAPLDSLALAQGKQDEKVTLKWKFTKGESLRYEMSQTMDIDVMGQEMKYEMLFGFVMGVQEVAENGTGTLDMRYDRVKVKMSGIMEVDYDSDAPKKEGEKKDEEEGVDVGAMMAKAFGAMVGKSMTMKMSPRGEITEVKGLDKILESMGEEMGGQEEMLKGMFSEDQLKQMFSSGWVALPDKPVAKGDAWDSNLEFKTQGIGVMVMKSRLTLHDVRGKDAVIKIATKIESKADGDEPAMGELAEGSKMDSEVVWSIEHGRVESMTGTMILKMAAAGQEFEVSAAMTMKLAPKKERKEH